MAVMTVALFGVAASDHMQPLRIAPDVERRLRKLAKQSRAEAFLVQVHPRVAAILIGGGGKPLGELETEPASRS